MHHGILPEGARVRGKSRPASRSWRDLIDTADSTRDVGIVLCDQDLDVIHINPVAAALADHYRLGARALLHGSLSPRLHGLALDALARRTDLLVDPVFTGTPLHLRATRHDRPKPLAVSLWLMPQSLADPLVVEEPGDRLRQPDLATLAALGSQWEAIVLAAQTL
jgi:hypothetical protein